MVRKACESVVVLHIAAVSSSGRTVESQTLRPNNSVSQVVCCMFLRGILISSDLTVEDLSLDWT